MKYIYIYICKDVYIYKRERYVYWKIMKKTRILPSPHLEGPQVPSIQAAEDKVVKVVFPADLPKLDSRGHHAFRPRDPRLPQEMILKSWPKLVAWGDIIGFFFGKGMKWWNGCVLTCQTKILHEPHGHSMDARHWVPRESPYWKRIRSDREPWFTPWQFSAPTKQG